jgi:hypothetical protein
MRGILLVVAICLAVSSAMPAVAQQKNPLPSSGTFKVHLAGRGLEKLQSLVTIETSAPVISME